MLPVHHPMQAVHAWGASLCLTYSSVLICSMGLGGRAPEATLVLVTEDALLHKPPCGPPQRLSRIDCPPGNSPPSSQPLPEGPPPPEKDGSVTADLCACRTAPSARRRGQRTSCAPTATAGCAARAPRSTGTALRLGAHSFPGPTRDHQVPLPAVLTGSRAPKQWLFLTLLPCWG